MQVPMPVLECAACLRLDLVPFQIPTPVTLETPRLARDHFRQHHADPTGTDPDRCAVHVEFPDEGPSTFDVRPMPTQPERDL